MKVKEAWRVFVEALEKELEGCYEDVRVWNLVDLLENAVEEALQSVKRREEAEDEES